MSDESIIRQLREANPFPNPVDLHRASTDDARILVAINERSDAMSTKQTRRVTIERTPTPRRGLLIAAAVAAAVVLAGAVILDVFRPEVATPDDETTLSLVSEWVDAVNAGDLQGALAVLSPEASCDLPIPTLGADETCEQHLGYLIAIDTHFEPVGCSSVEPTRCKYSLTSGLHAALGYPDYALPLETTFSVDRDGKLTADIFGTIDPTTPYWPREGGELWAYMQPLYPELDIDATFGPSPYTAAAGVAAMEAAAEFNGAGRVAQRLQEAVDLYSDRELQLCFAPQRTDCSDLLDFLEGVAASIQLDCDPSTAGEGVITCPMAVDSDLNATLGGGQGVTEITIEYRAGKVRTITFDPRFSGDEDLHSSFLEYAAEVDGLFDGDQPIWDGETAPVWMETARQFVGS